MNFMKSSKKGVSDEPIIDTASSMTVLGAGTTVKGKIKSNNDIRVDGKISGDIVCDKKVVVGEKGNLEVNLNTNELTIEGSFQGEVKASKQVRIGSKGVLSGDLSTPSLIVEEGAMVNSHITMNKKG